METLPRMRKNRSHEISQHVGTYRLQLLEILNEPLIEVATHQLSMKRHHTGNHDLLHLKYRLDWMD